MHLPRKKIVEREVKVSLLMKEFGDMNERVVKLTEIIGKIVCLSSAHT